MEIRGLPGTLIGIFILFMLCIMYYHISRHLEYRQGKYLWEKEKIEEEKRQKKVRKEEKKLKRLNKKLLAQQKKAAKKSEEMLSLNTDQI